MTTATVFTEVMVGAYHLGAQYVARTGEMFDLIEVVAVDRPLADETARIGGGLRRIGVALDAVDLSVAALALRRRQSVLTRDEDFLRVPGLSVQSY